MADSDAAIMEMLPVRSRWISRPKFNVLRENCHFPLHPASFDAISFRWVIRWVEICQNELRN
jgi:hypothetical protein